MISALVALLVLTSPARAVDSPAVKPPAKTSKSKPAALKPATAAYLKEVGFDPASAQIREISGDKITDKAGEVTSLDSLASDRDRLGMKRFVSTRVFARAYRENPETPFPPRNLYETSYLKPDEVQFILMQLRQVGAK